jgi:lipopolysaccharide biosynthesis protein
MVLAMSEKSNFIQFSHQSYLERYPSAGLLGLEFEEHYTRFGKRLGYFLSPNLLTGTAEQVSSSAEQATFEACVLLVLFSSTNRLTEQQIAIVEFYRAAGVYVFALVNCECSEEFQFPLESIGVTFLVRQNIGFDFGAWKEAIISVPEWVRFKRVVFSNDSIIPLGDPENLKSSLAKANDLNKDVVFATVSNEIKKHGQSFFFVLMTDSAKSFFADYLSSLPVYDDKDTLIQNVEVNMLECMVAGSLSVEGLYRIREAEEVSVNPSILYWETLIKLGFPFIKAQLFSAGFLSLDDENIKRHISAFGIEMLRDHLQVRSNQSLSSHTALEGFNTFEQTDKGNFDSRPRNLEWVTPTHLKSLPIEISTQSTNTRPFRIAIQVHMYFVDIFEEVVTYIDSINRQFDLFVTTDTMEKKNIILSLVSDISFLGTIEVLVCDNHGRDVKPFLIQFAKVYHRYDLFAHFHTKKAETVEWGEQWRVNIFENLLANSQRVDAIIACFQNDENLGLVIPTPYLKIAPVLNWGGLKGRTEALLASMNAPVILPETAVFPAGNMFWARTSAMRQTLARDWKLVDFEDEHGQVGETLMHAIERHWVYLAAYNGFQSSYVGQKG